MRRISFSGGLAIFEQPVSLSVIFVPEDAIDAKLEPALAAAFCRTIANDRNGFEHDGFV